jgi:hypothetical protein
MEVHHHPDLHHNRKKFKEYFLEFLMIFLAVTMGFIAENIRESIVENHSEKQYMTSLVRDLQLDTLELAKGNLFRIQKIRALDSILNILAEQNASQVSWVAYSLSRQFSTSRNFYQNSGTLDQLKNSGGLRLIRNRAIVDSIEAYDQQVRRMRSRDDFETEAFIYNSRISEKLFEAKSVIKIFGLSNDPNVTPGGSGVLKINLPYLNEYINNLMKYELLIKNNVVVFESNRQKATNLIQLIEKEYHLE